MGSALPQFTTPTVRMRPEVDVPPPFNRMVINVGVTILKKDGGYHPTTSASDEAIAAADVAYIGGRVYEVSEAEAADLRAAGYEVQG